jgi:ubiquinone/menaquinone biosynthesis C-methylase UbiE
MTGLDFSPAALKQAQRIAAAASTEIDFVESEVYAALDVLPRETFDLVFTGIGALCERLPMTCTLQAVKEN